MLSDDGVAMGPLSAPNVDWAGVNQPGGFVGHQAFNWAYGNLNAPHTLYRSLAADHGDFNSQPYRLIMGPARLEQYVVAALSYKGGLIVGKYPLGTYFVDTSTDVNPANWTAVRVADPGWAGPHAGDVVEDDVIWVSPDGSWHSLNATQGIQKASIRSSDLSYRKLTSWPAQNINLSLLANADFIYYADRQELMFTFPAAGSLTMNRRLHMDLNNKDEVGENWVLWDRDHNACLYLRQGAGGRLGPIMGDYAGQLWLLDQPTRVIAGASAAALPVTLPFTLGASLPQQAYPAEFFLQDTDFSPLFGAAWATNKKNARFLVIQYIASGPGQMTIEIYLDGVKSQTITVTLQGAAQGLPLQLPFQLAAPTLILTTPPQALVGQFQRMAIRGYSAAPNVDMNIAKLVIGAELAA